MGNDRPDVRQLGVHAAREKDDAQGYHPDELRVAGIVELQSQTVAPEKHPDEQEEQQRRDAEFITGLAYDYANENEC